MIRNTEAGAVNSFNNRLNKKCGKSKSLMKFSARHQQVQVQVNIMTNKQTHDTRNNTLPKPCNNQYGQKVDKRQS